MKEAVITGAARTAAGSFLGRLAAHPAPRRGAGGREGAGGGARGPGRPRGVSAGGGATNGAPLRGCGADPGERNGSERSQVASVCYEEAAREHLALGEESIQGIGPIGDLHYGTQH